MRHLLLTVALAIGLSTAIADVASAQQLKTAAQCNADYSANKAAIKGAKIKKRDFVASCRAGNETIPGTTAATAPTPAVAPAPAPSSPSPTPSRRKVVPPTSAGTGSPTGAYQFASAAEAGSRCPGATVVWVNTASGVYHFAGARNYGHTKAGAYMCETDATAAGDRASKTEKHP